VTLRGTSWIVRWPLNKNFKLTHYLSPNFHIGCPLALLYCPPLTANCFSDMSTIQTDFDRIALVSPDGAAHNDHYHSLLLRHLPPTCNDVLEIGCGTGAFARCLAQRSKHVLALDLSPEMIRIARESSAQFPNIEFQLADVRDRPLPAESFDCIASIATLHHLSYAEILLKMKAALKPGGVLLVLDLFEPARISDSLVAGLSDSLLNLLALPVSATLRLIHLGRLLPSRETRDAWAAHERHDLYPTMTEVHGLCERILPGAKIKKHLLWRYSIVWRKAP
jgi:SAM-dependent methyltransferase